MPAGLSDHIGQPGRAFLCFELLCFVLLCGLKKYFVPCGKMLLHTDRL